MTKKFSLITLTAMLFFSTMFVINPGLNLSSSGVSTAFAEAPGKSASAFDRKITARFSSDNAMEHIYHLSVEIGPRVAGTEEEWETAEYIQNELESYGYNTHIQEFGIPDRVEGSLTASYTDDEIPMRLATGSAGTDAEGLTAEIYHAGLGYPEDFTEEAEGKIALIQRGGFTFWEKTVNAAEAGAAGVIIYDNSASSNPFTPSLGGNVASVPVMGITMADGEAMAAAAEDGHTATIQVTAFENQTSPNVIAVKEPKGGPPTGQDPEIVYVTAHFDSVPGSPGASDNASGTGTALELARILKAYPTEKEIRFVFVGAEEIGLLGARHYVSELSDDEISRSAANFNMDMVGTAWEQATALYVNVVDGQPNAVWQAASAAAERLGNDTLVLFQRGSSDHVAFHDAGIDAANFIRREPGTASLEPWYHTPEDTFDKISQERIQEAGELIGSAIYDFSSRTVPGRGPGGR